MVLRGGMLLSLRSSRPSLLAWPHLTFSLSFSLASWAAVGTTLETLKERLDVREERVFRTAIAIDSHSLSSWRKATSFFVGCTFTST